MRSTRVQQIGRRLDRTRSDGDLPSLSILDRVALRISVRLILRGQRHAERREHDAQQRWFAADRAAEEARTVFERRVWAGPVRW